MRPSAALRAGRRRLHPPVATGPAEAPLDLVEPPAAVPVLRKRVSPWRRMARDFAESPIALGALAVLSVLVLAAIFAPWITPHDPYDLRSIDLMDALLPPGELSMAGDPFLLGTDGQGRDMLSAMVYGLRVSIGVGVSSVLLALIAGIGVGLLAAYFGGWVDALLMRFVDLQLSMPSILVALILVALLGQGVDKVVLALVIVQWAYFARTLRAAAMVERKKEYVEAAIGLDVGRARVMFTHMLPNALPPLIVSATLTVGVAILFEAGLSFLGLGDPNTMSWGLMIGQNRGYLLEAWWPVTLPGLAIFLTVFAISLIGDGLNDAFNPKLRSR